MKENDSIGWEMRYVNLPKDLDVSPFFYEWEPYELTLHEFLLVDRLCNGVTINTKSDNFTELLKLAETDEDSFIQELNNKKLIYKDEESNLLLLTDECIAGIKNGKYYAGENKDGKMMRWLVKKN